MHGRSKSIAGKIPGPSCDRAGRTDRDVFEGASGVTPNTDPASCKRECAWESKCNCECDCRKFHGCLLCCLDKRQPHRHHRFFFSAIEAGKLFTSRRSAMLSKKNLIAD